MEWIGAIRVYQRDLWRLFHVITDQWRCWRERAQEAYSTAVQGLKSKGGSIDSQTGRAKWAGTKHDTAHSASARHRHDSYSDSAGTTRI